MNRNKTREFKVISVTNIISGNPSRQRGVSIVDGKISVSKIYDWFIEDFGGTEETILRHLQHYAAPELVARLEEIGKLSDEHYDWSINAAAE